GVDFGKDTIAYCRIGERSAHTWFVLHEFLGQPNVKNYDGSWTEYGSLVGVTISKDKSSKEAVIEGQVLRGGAPVSPGYARLLGTGDEFVAEVPLGEDGGFRFFAAPGSWTLRVLAPHGLRA